MKATIKTRQIALNACAKLKKLLLVAGIIGTCASNASAISVDTGASANALVMKLLGDVGENSASRITSISNATISKGNSAQKGIFTGVTMGFTEGIILSSGNAASGSSTSYSGGGDSDLDNLGVGTSHDAVALEFDFVPQVGTISFMYRFCSNEWTTYPSYSDAFALYVNGSNKAILPNGKYVTNTNVVATLNASNPANRYGQNNPGSWGVPFSGCSITLAVNATVNVGVTNHMKIAISDAFDSVIDSQTLLAGGSFKANNPPAANIAIPSQTAYVGSAYSYQIPTNAFSDADNDTLTYTATKLDGSALPSGLALSSSGLFSGTPANGTNGTYTIKVVASDGAATASTTFTLVIKNDSDLDGWPDPIDNCPFFANPDQANADGDSISSVVSNEPYVTVGGGDACDNDDDNDGVLDATDNCHFVSNPDQFNWDSDSLGDACDPDDDNDGVADTSDNCHYAPNPNQDNNDSDSVTSVLSLVAGVPYVTVGGGDACDNDDDNDGVLDVSDNCQFVANPDQANNDNDTVAARLVHGGGDLCDDDDDNDDVIDTLDNCHWVANSTQQDQDSDGVGNSCDNDYQGPRVSIDNVSVEEGNSGTRTATFTVSLDHNTTLPFNLNWLVNDGTATTADSDYVDGSGTLSFFGNEGETHTISIVVNGDSKVELDETFTVVLSNISAGDAIFGDNVGVGTISNDDNSTITISDASITEGGTLSFAVSMTNIVDTDISINATTSDGTAFAGSDFTGVTAQTISFAAGETSKTLSVNSSADSTVELNERFYVSLAVVGNSGRNITLGDGLAVGTIIDNDSATISIGDITVLEGNEGSTVYALPVTLNHAVDTALTVDYVTADGTAALSDGDYNPSFGTVTFNGDAGEVQYVLIEGFGDTKYEHDEQFTVTISALDAHQRNVAISDDTAVATIQNDDSPPSVTLATNRGSVAEDGGTATLTFTQDAVTGADTVIGLSFSGNAGRPADYTLNNTVTIPIGSTSATLTLASVDDDDVEVDEIATVDISSVVDGTEHGTQRVSVSIIDDEGPLDYDSDGITNIGECPSGVPCPDSDLDGTLDLNDTDSDNDGLLDSLECPSGVPCADDDSDGITNQREASTIDTDGDGLVDQADADDDGDTIPTAVECALGYACTDSDNDDIPDYLDADIDGPGSGDSDQDGLSDAVECASGYPCPDSDLDKNPDYMQTDSDSDGVADGTEGASTDSDSDGIPDRSESGLIDTDGDSLVDQLDADDDGDNVATSVECSSGIPCADADEDNIPDYLDADVGDSDSGDSDSDGISDAVECPGGYICADTDADSIPDYMDTDADNDGIADSIEGTVDTDEDGTPDNKDLDSDNDGISDHDEGATDTDSDGTADFRDLDCDGDGISDSTEGNVDADSDGTANYKDSDSDGDTIADSIESSVDSDSDGTANYLDLDSDGDGLSDSVEGVTDVDGDGLGDYLDLDSDGDGIADSVEGAGDLDTDGDGIPDRIDPDSDGDGILDVDETSADSDADGIPNYIDTDSDGDSISDAIEGATDTDGDGHSNATDIDSDGDGIPDSVEGTTDSDADGRANYLDVDSDNDGVLDRIEAQSTLAYVPASGRDSDNDGLDDAYDTDNGGVAQALVDTDSDSISDYLDTDSDADGVPDVIEAHDLDRNGAPELVPAHTDSNSNGLDDAFEACIAPETISNLYRDPVQLTCVDLSSALTEVSTNVKRLRNQLGEFLLLRAKIAKACKLPTGHKNDERTRHSAERLYLRIGGLLAGLPLIDYSTCQIGSCSAVDYSQNSVQIQSLVRELADLSLGVLGNNCSKLGTSERSVKRGRSVIRTRRGAALAAISRYPAIPIICQR